MKHVRVTCIGFWVFLYSCWFCCPYASASVWLENASPKWLTVQSHHHHHHKHYRGPSSCLKVADDDLTSFLHQCLSCAVLNTFCSWCTRSFLDIISSTACWFSTRCGVGRFKTTNSPFWRCYELLLTCERLCVSAQTVGRRIWRTSAMPTVRAAKCSMNRSAVIITCSTIHRATPVVVYSTTPPHQRYNHPHLAFS